MLNYRLKIWSTIYIIFLYLFIKWFYIYIYIWIKVSLSGQYSLSRLFYAESSSILSIGGRRIDEYMLFLVILQAKSTFQLETQKVGFSTIFSIQKSLNILQPTQLSIGPKNTNGRILWFLPEIQKPLIDPISYF